MSPAEADTASVDTNTLAVDRTFLAYERTLMAWIRTATSLITFGFSVYKYFQYLRDARPGPETHRWVEPRTFGLAMIAFGLTTLVLGMLQHRRGMKRLPAARVAGQLPMAPVAAAVLAVLGCFACVLIILNQ